MKSFNKSYLSHAVAAAVASTLPASLLRKTMKLLKSKKSS